MKVLGPVLNINVGSLLSLFFLDLYNL